jgi:hypothetical protein
VTHFAHINIAKARDKIRIGSSARSYHPTTAGKNKQNMSNFKVTIEKMHTVIFSVLTEYHSECLQALQ